MTTFHIIFHLSAMENSGNAADDETWGRIEHGTTRMMMQFEDDTKNIWKTLLCTVAAGRWREENEMEIKLKMTRETDVKWETVWDNGFEKAQNYNGKPKTETPFHVL